MECWGEEETYDLEVNHSSHNYIANGVVVHNSQRYSSAFTFTTREARSQDLNNRQNSIDDLDQELKDDFIEECELLVDRVQGLYDYYTQENGIAKECSRVFLPEGLTMSRLYMKGSLRSWMHYLEVREGNGTQLEHIQLANKIREALLPAFPITLGMTSQ